MIRIHRIEGRESVSHAHRQFTLVSWTWTVRIGRPTVGVGWRYHHPQRVELDGRVIPILDHVFLVRVGAALVLAAVSMLMWRAAV